MQKAFAFFWLVVYTVVSTGFAVSTHFCMGAQQAVSLGVAKSDVCGNCGMHTEESNGCCRDDVKVVKLQQEGQTAKMLLPSSQSNAPVTIPSFYLLSPFYNFTQGTTAVRFEPPLPVQDRCVANCIFRI